MRRVHLFCPTFIDTVGTVEFEEIQFDEVVRIIADPTNDPIWRSSWPSVLRMLNRYGKLNLPSEQQRREIISAHRPMQIDELGIIIRTIGKVDLKTAELTPMDCLFTQCYRISTGKHTGKQT